MKHWKPAAISILLAAWFFAHSWRGLFVNFEGDDMMNTYKAWILPWPRLLAANLTPFSTVYRPFGSLYYHGMFSLVGFRPLGFRIVTYAFLLANVFLIYRLARLITGSAEIGVFAALLGSYHPRLMDLLLNNGTVYDVLACTFALLAMCLYVQKRPVWFLVSFVVALNCKEMAAAVPAILLVYDWVWRRKLGSPAWWISAAVTGIAFVVKRSAPEFANVPDYWMHFNVHQFFATARPLTSELLYLPAGALNTTYTVLVFVLIWAVALAARSKPLLFAAAFATFAPLPINFITYRGFFVMYLPLAGWAIYAATALVEGRDWLLKNVWKRPPLSEQGWEPERVALFLLVAYALFNVQSDDRGRVFDPSKLQTDIRMLHDELSMIAPRLPSGAKILLRHDPFAPQTYDPVFTAQLTYRDPSVIVDRGEGKPGEKYDLILDYVDNRFRPAPF